SLARQLGEVRRWGCWTALGSFPKITASGMRGRTEGKESLMRIDQRIFTAFFLFAAAQHASAEFIPLGDLPGGAFFSRAQGVSADGSAVVGASASDSGLFDAFRWIRPAGMVRLGSLPTSAFYFSTAIAAS